MPVVQGGGPGFDLGDRALILNPGEQRGRGEGKVDEAWTGDGGLAEF